MKTRSSASVFKWAKALFLVLFLLAVLFPFLWMLLTSLKGTKEEIYAFPVRYLPDPVSFENYRNMLEGSNFGHNILNSLLVSTLAGLFAVIIGAMAGYVLARFRFKLRGPLLFFFLFTQMIPMFLMLAPLYSMMSRLHLLNNTLSLIIVYTNMMIPFSVVTLKGFFQGVSSSIEEAAQIDGCGRLRALFLVIVPVILPGIASAFIFSFVNSWNELFAAIMFINDDRFKTIPVALNALIQKYDVKWGEMSAGTILSVLPTAFLFVFAQNYMAEGLTTGAVKG